MRGSRPSGRLGAVGREGSLLLLGFWIEGGIEVASGRAPARGSMTKVLMSVMMKSHGSRVGAGFLFWFGVSACGSSGGTASGDAGNLSDRESPRDGMSTTDARSGGDGETRPGDAGNMTDGNDAADDENAPDGESLSPGAVNLGAAGHYVILAKSGISTVPTSAVTGDIAVSPAAATYITGFSLKANPANAFSTSTQVTGKVYASDYAPPTPSELTTAIGDMMLAFTDAAGRAPGVTELGAGNIGGMTLKPGVYRWGTGLLVPTAITLTGAASDVWIFQIAKDLTVSSGANVVLSGGALSKNVFWQVAGLADLGTTAHFEGIILSGTSIGLGTGASIDGRLMAQTAVSIAGSTVARPAL
jgi:hypothetical protein